MITPKEIENKVFSSAMRGYKREEVDQFLDQILMDFELLLNENAALKNNVANMQQEIAERKKSENSVMQTLEQAKSLMSDISASAEKRAEVIIRNAQSDASKIVQDAKDSVLGLRRESETLRASLQNFRERYKSMLNDELNKLDVTEGAEDLFADFQDDFLPASMSTQKPVAMPKEQSLGSGKTMLSHFGFSSMESTKPVVEKVETRMTDTRPLKPQGEKKQPSVSKDPLAFDAWLNEQTGGEAVTMSAAASAPTPQDMPSKPEMTVDDKAKTIVLERPIPYDDMNQ